jgi:hypothetical protein
MKMHFTIVINGKDSLEKKFEEQVNSNKDLHMGMIRCFAQTIMLALHLDQSDDISVESFIAAKIPEQDDMNESEKKVDK